MAPGPGAAGPGQGVASGEPAPGRRLEAAIRVTGGALVVWVAALAAVCEVFWVPLRVGETRAPVSLAAAVLLNLTLPVLARWVTGSRRAALLPSLVWFTLILTFAWGTSEGDVLLAGNDPAALGLLLLGAPAAAVGAGVGVSPPLWLRGLDRAQW